MGPEAAIGCIVGLVVRVGDNRDIIRDQLTQLEGVELHAEDNQGRLVLTLEARTQRQAMLLTEEMQNFDGVLQVMPAYQYCDESPEVAEQGGWSWR